jgi:hypothetical protein
VVGVNSPASALGSHHFLKAFLTELVAELTPLETVPATVLAVFVTPLATVLAVLTVPLATVLATLVAVLAVALAA